MEEWKECKLGEITSLITKGTTPSMIGANFTTNGIKYIKSECILENSRLLDSSKYTFISTETNERLKRSQIIENDILFSMAGMFLGKTGIATKDDVPANTNQAVAIIRITPEKADFKYVYYFLNQKALITYINGISGQSAQPNINLQQISELNIKLPPLPTQQKIAAILSSLDDKIELNNKINTNLEQQAGALFKNWFVDFEPFGGKMPEGWKGGKLSEIGTIVGGSTPSKAKKEYYTNKGIAWITPKDLSNDKSKFISHGEIDITELGFKNSSAIKMPKGTVLYSSRAPIGYIAISKNEVTTNQGFKSVIPNVNVGNGYIYYFLKSNYELIDSLASGSTFKEISGSAMKNIPVLVPDEQTLLDFQSFCFGIFDKQEKLEEENRKLASLRESLLPKLMNGEIGV